VSKDLAKAVKFYTKSQEGGYAGGTFALGRCWENGIGVKQDLKKALTLYQQAARQGHEEAEEAVKRLQKKSFKWPWQKKL